MSPSRLQGVHSNHEVLEAVIDSAPDSCGGKVEDNGVQAGIESTGKQCHVPPSLTVLTCKAHHMGHIVWPKADCKHQQGAEGQTNDTKPPPTANVGQSGQNEDEVDIAEATYQERDTEKNQEELQADWDQDSELFVSEHHVAGCSRGGRGSRSVVAIGITTTTTGTTAFITAAATTF